MSALSSSLVFLIQTLGSLYIMAVLLRFLLQLVRADFYNPISQAIVKATSPLLNPLRRIIPGVGGIDMAALSLALVLQIALLYAVFGLKGFSLASYSFSFRPDSKPERTGNGTVEHLHVQPDHHCHCQLGSARQLQSGLNATAPVDRASVESCPQSDTAAGWPGLFPDGTGSYHCHSEKLPGGSVTHMTSHP